MSGSLTPCRIFCIGSGIRARLKHLRGYPVGRCLARWAFKRWRGRGLALERGLSQAAPLGTLSMLCRGQGGLLLVVAGEAKGRAERADGQVGDCVRPVLVSIQAGNVGGVLVAGGQCNRTGSCSTTPVIAPVAHESGKRCCLEATTDAFLAARRDRSLNF